MYPHRYSVHSRLGLSEAYLRIWYVEPQVNRDLVLHDLRGQGARCFYASLVLESVGTFRDVI